MKKIIFQILLTIINCSLLFSQKSNPITNELFITKPVVKKNEFIHLKFEEINSLSIKIDSSNVYKKFNEHLKLNDYNETNIVNEERTFISNEMSNSHTIDTINPKKQIEKLKFIRSYKILKNEQKLYPEEIRVIINSNSLALDEYDKGKVLVDVGNVALAGGIGLIIGGGINNLNKASSTNTNSYYSREKKGSPAIIIAGIVIGCISIPLKIIGRNTIKSSIDTYNGKTNTSSRIKDANLILFSKNNIVGLCYKF